jgi:hypothetical protein
MPGIIPAALEMPRLPSRSPSDWVRHFGNPYESPAHEALSPKSTGRCPSGGTGVSQSAGLLRLTHGFCCSFGPACRLLRSVGAWWGGWAGADSLLH